MASSSARRAPQASVVKDQLQRQRDLDRFTAQDSIVVSLKDDHRDPFALLRNIQGEIAEEAASMRFKRVEENRYGRSSENLSVKRIQAMKDIASIELKVRELGEVAIDVTGERFQRVFKLWIGLMTEAAEVLEETERDIYLNKLSSVMEGWEDKAALALRS